jgi:serine/threonine protein kinase
LDRNNWPTPEKSHFISIFRKEELKPILRSSNFIGKGAFAEVYKGVVDNTLVVVKKTINDKVHKNKELENEVIIQSQIIHKNIVLLIGCCLEMDTPVLVYEFLPRGSLHDILHGGNKVALNLDMRLNIVAESAHGLAYLHSQARTKIWHGDVRPATILLDDNLIPKNSDFGLSRVVVRDKQHAYMDPAYLQRGLSSEKSDVYSFGIVILEVISRKKATHSDDFSLVKSFLELDKEGKKATDLFDKDIAVTGNFEFLYCLTDIAVECLNLNVDQRPSMPDVAERLRILNQSRRLHARHIVEETRRADYSDGIDISSSLVEQQEMDQLSLGGMQNTNHHGTSISSSISTGFYKFNNLDIFNRKARRNFDRNCRRTLQKSHFIKIFRKEELTPMLSSSILIGKDAFAEVYKGVLDNVLVAVKKATNADVYTNKELENEV